MSIKHITMMYAQVRDPTWWILNSAELNKWLDIHTELGASESVQGDRVYFLHDEELLWFKLRWHA